MNTKLGRIAIYFRVSTDKQEFISQRDKVYDYLDSLEEGRPAGRDIKHFTEKISGKKNRPQYNKMIAACQAGRFQTIIVYKLDRLSRSFNDFMTVFLALNKQGVRIISVSQPEYNQMSGVYKEFFHSVLAFVADLESTFTSERTKAALDSAKRRGVKLGRKDHILDSQKITNIINCLNAGWKVTEICRELKVSTFSVYKIKREIADSPSIAHETGEIAR